MTIDERLEKLTERHEALTQSVELMVAENRARDRKWEENWRKWDAVLGKLAGSMESLAKIVTNHERRIEKLEG